MITRQDYMKDSSKLHRQYYAQFVNDKVKQRVLDTFGLETLKKSYAKDEHFNTNLTPLKKWDLLGGWSWGVIRGEQIAIIQPRSTTDILPVEYSLLKEAGEGLSNSTMVCIYKEAGRQIIEK